MPPLCRTAIIPMLMASALAVTALSASAQDEEYSAPRLIAPATAGMQKADFWIERLDGDPDEVMMSPAGIDRLNRANAVRPLETTDINGDPYSIADIVERKDVIGIRFRVADPLEMTPISGDSLRARFDRAERYLRDGKFWDRRQLEFDDAMKDDLIAKTAPASIPETVRPRYGILVRHSLSRVFPTEYPGWNRKGGRLDVFQATAVDMGTAVAVLHSSPEGDWLYCATELSLGWFKSENVAYGSPEEIRQYIDKEPFIVSIDHTVPVYGDRSMSSHMTDFYLGEKLPVTATDQGMYTVLEPFRDYDGSLRFVEGFIRSDAPVSEGYQSFTRRNVLETVFRLNYRPYGWADSFNERDCCGTMRSVYRTFGFIMPRWTTHELHFADRCHAFSRDTAREVKYGIIDGCQPGVTLVGHRGHISMYIGKAAGSYFVIHQSGYGYDGEDGKRYIVQRVSVNDTLLQGGSHVDTWTEIAEFRE